MKIVIYLTACTLLCKTVFSQVNIDPKSISVPRYANLTAIQALLPSPQTGAIVYNNQTNTFFYYNGSAWSDFATVGGAGLWTPTANFIKNINTDGFWSEGALAGFQEPVNTPVNGFGARLMWLPKFGAFRAGFVAEGFNSWDSDSIGRFSVALGFSPKAKGRSSIALGEFATASANHSMALGEMAQATTSQAIALGQFTEATGLGAFAAGQASKARGFYSVAIGMGAQAYGIGSFASGISTVASGNNSISLGNSSVASGPSSTSIGQFTTAIGNYSTAMGVGNIATAHSSFVVGRYNLALPAGGATTTDPAHPIFIVGNGETEESRSNAMVVTFGGRTGIGVNDPQTTLDVNGRIRIRHNGISGGIWMSNSANGLTDNDGAFFGLQNAAPGQEIAGIWMANGWRFSVDRQGVGYLTSLVQNSDERLKRDISPLTGSLSNLNKLTGYHYYWKEESRGWRLQTGLIAQEVEKVFPELVQKDNEGMLSVNYIGFIPHLIEVNKELATQNEKLTTEVNNLKKQLLVVDELKKRMEAIEANLNSATTGK